MVDGIKKVVGSRSAGFRWLWSPAAFLYLWLPIALVTIGHYSVGPKFHWMHDVFRRLYYIPIILGAFLFGLRGSLTAAIISSVIYMPHAFTNFFSRDPSGNVEKILEILLYNIIALITGILADNQRRARAKQEDISQQLREKISELVLLEEQLIRAGRLQALGALTAGLAHEIKNPLASIKGTAEIIADSIPEDSDSLRMVEIQSRELNRLEKLLERFLSFARPNRSDFAEMELTGSVGEVISLVEAQAKKNGVELTFESPAELKITADRQKISQIILNLLVNGIEIQKDGGTIDVEIGRERIGKIEYAFVSVIDGGPGFAGVDQEKIFDPFYTTSDNGVGLGLSIAARLADEHGGFIKAEQAAGGGAAFIVFFPLNKGEQE